MNHVLSIYNLDLVKAVKEAHAMLKKKEDELRSDEVNLEKEYDITTRMLKCAQSQMDKAIENNDMVGMRVSRELLKWQPRSWRQP